MKRAFVSIAAVAALSPLVAQAAPTPMSDADLDRVVAGWSGIEPVPNCGVLYVCGNNGWGNGPDSTNPGSGTMESPRGVTTISKATNGGETDGRNPNVNPLPSWHSTGR